MTGTQLFSWWIGKLQDEKRDKGRKVGKKPCRGGWLRHPYSCVGLYMGEPGLT
jgi:hypothetical protein